MAIYMVKPWYKKSGADTAIYGAEWDGSSSPAWTRTDAAANFAGPNPQYAMANNTWSVGSSPFDNIMPWAGMRIVEDSEAGTLVEIPKFWYKWTRAENAMKLQITADAATATANSFLCSPAHADRGDGVGERDYVYVGRYISNNTSATRYKSTTDVKPLDSSLRSDMRTNIHSLGSNVWLWDYATLWTVRMLYLVEFAHWDSQTKIGYGGGATKAVVCGGTDSMTYHTGTNQTSRTSYGYTQYRYIEDLWGNIRNWVDGIYITGGSSVYIIKNPSKFSDYQNGTQVYTGLSTSAGYIKAYSIPSVSGSYAGYEYALVPSNIDSTLTGTTFICDKFNGTNNSRVAPLIGSKTQSLECGLFCEMCTSNENAFGGGRLMKLPASRLS